MSRVLITGSADGLGREAARLLVGAGHEVVLHARDEARAREALADVPGAAAALPATSPQSHRRPSLRTRRTRAARSTPSFTTRPSVTASPPNRNRGRPGARLPGQRAALPPHRACDPSRPTHLPQPGLHRAGNPSFDDLQWRERPWDGYQAYADSKLFDAVLAAAVARRWPKVVSNSVDPGWVKTKMGGPTAPGDIGPGADTQAWLAVSDDPLALRSGGYLHHRQRRQTHPAVSDHAVQDGLLAACHGLTDRALPEGELS